MGATNTFVFFYCLFLIVALFAGVDAGVAVLRSGLLSFGLLLALLVTFEDTAGS